MRLIAWWQDGDCIIGAHVRDTEVETQAAVDAARLRAAGAEPAKVGSPLPRVSDQVGRRDLRSEEAERFFKWRVYQNWVAMGEVFASHKPQRRSAKASV